MSEPLNRLRREPYWILIILLGTAGLTLFIHHLATGQTPDRVAFRMPIFNFDVYWYGILIVGGIGLGCWVVAGLAARRARSRFLATVPDRLRRIELTRLDLPPEITSGLQRRGLNQVGDILFEWGLDPQRLPLKRARRHELRQQLQTLPGFEDSWLEDAPWRQWNPDHVWAGVAWALVLGVIGARLYHVLTPSPSMAAFGIESPLDYFRSPQQLINLRNGGLGIYGGIAGGALGLWIYTYRQRLDAISWADLAVVGLALGQAVGRWGNFFNQELYGRPSQLPWAITIDPPRLTGYESFSRFHPAFLYESLWMLATFALLYYLARNRWRRLFSGDLMALFLVSFALNRIVLELVRLDSRTVSLGDVDLGLPVATLVSIIVALPMAVLLIRRHLLPGDDLS
ncbi:MAG: prolipoprotein diacylglyceryl transferase [Candidatus Promineifilaceae bacterium]|nr:prolipoprotein diacylglyceryl transferase [Candidatus Promineifilaceae bacterium]